MTRYSFNLLNYRFRLELRKTRRKTFLSPLKAHIKALGRVRSGNKISWVFRHILERSNIKKLLGGNLALSVMLFGVLAPGASALSQAEPELTTLSVSSGPLTTEVVIQYPVDPVIVNQGYHFFHWGIDLDGVTGDSIKPIAKGRVARVETSRWGYGNAVLIEHENGLQSLYAHLSKADVQEGQEVDTRTVIGKMGSTGHSTGDHLHLETYKNGRVVNPRTILGR